MTGWPSERVALVFEDQEYTYGWLGKLAGGYAAALAARGVKPGDRVALMGSNRPEWVAAVLGTWRAGAAVALFSPAWKQAEAQHAVRIVRPVCGIGDHPVLPGLLPVLGFGEPAPREPRLHSILLLRHIQRIHIQRIHMQKQSSFSPPARPGCRRRCGIPTRAWPPRSRTGGTAWS